MWQDFLDLITTNYDILLSPTLSHAPPKIGYIGPEVSFDTHFERVCQYVAFTPLQNTAGAPAISLPMGFSRNGLPIGIQFAAAYGQESVCLSSLSNSKKPSHGPWSDSSRPLTLTGC